jgi:hypothetical protein
MSRISLGSHASDGLRVGPIYSQLSSLPADLGGPFPSGNFSDYGPGVLLSPQHTYKIWPSMPNIPGGYHIIDNIVASIRPAARGYLTLLGDNFVTFATVGKDGMPLIQFDWPRVPTVTVSGVAANPNTYVTIFGIDRYGENLQHTYQIGGETALPRTYPTVQASAGANDGAIINPETGAPLPAKAFYAVTGVFISAATPVGCNISVGASDIFGLPYVITSKGNITSISWANQTNSGSYSAAAPYTYTNPVYPNTNAINQVSELTVRAPGAPQTTVGVFVRSDDTNPTTQVTGDVRGLYAPSSPSSFLTDNTGATKLDLKRLSFTYYVYGMDTWQNQVNNQQQNYMQQYQTTTPNGWPVGMLDPIDAYGYPQYYTGVPFG